MTAAPPTSELAAFIEARLSEDEAAANDLVALWDEAPPSVYDMAQVESLEAGDPARVLAQVAALRAVVALHEPYRGPRILKVDSTDTDFGCPICHCIDPIHDDGIIEALGTCPTLRHLAAIWASDPAFDPAWSA